MLTLARAARTLALITTMTMLGCNTGNEPADDGETEGFDEGEGLGEGECSDVCGTPGCGECPTADMVDGGGFMIDATEVSNGQYAALLEVSFDAAILPAGCEWKSGFEPDEWSDSLDPELPVVGVDWCDAAVFCAWADKQLCGAVGGGPADPDMSEDPDNDAWFRACSNAGVNAFPYGSAFDPDACNGEESGNDALLAVGSLVSCEGGVPGLFDMSGNVWEWVDACDEASGDATTQCRRRGGSRYSDIDNLGCGGNSKRARGERESGVGFRCCSG